VLGFPYLGVSAEGEAHCHVLSFVNVLFEAHHAWLSLDPQKSTSNLGPVNRYQIKKSSSSDFTRFDNSSLILYTGISLDRTSCVPGCHPTSYLSLRRLISHARVVGAIENALMTTNSFPPPLSNTESWFYPP
jgi:hypothetical protein